MKRLLFVLILAFAFISTKAQLYTFEEFVPSDWAVENGTVSLTNKTSKEGASSLMWTAKANSTILCPVSFTALSSNGTFFYIYSPRVTNDTITVSFYNENTLEKRANILCNFVGWRIFNRSYSEYATSSAANITSVCFSLKMNKAISGERTILFDKMDFNNTKDLNLRVQGPHMILDLPYLKGNLSYLQLYAFTRDIPLSEPTSKELQDLAVIRGRQVRQPATPTMLQIKRSLDYINSLGIEENADGTLRGKLIDITYGGLTDTYIQSVFSHLYNLSASPDYRDLFLKAVRYFLDQGIGEGCNYYMSSTMNFYTAGLDIPAKILDVAMACEEDLRQRLLDFAQWFCYYNEIYRSEDTYKANLISDYVYLYLSHFQAIAAFQSDDAVAIRELKAVKRYIERNTEYTPGCKGILKPDGTGFHHNSHYNNYMYSYMPWTQAMWGLRGTCFRVNEDAYKRFKKAVLSEYIMATKGVSDGNHYFANTFSGRNTFGSGISLSYSKEYFKQLIETGDDIIDDDVELKSAYNYFFDSSEYNVPKTDYEGFYAFNYSPAAIFRKSNWVVSMRSVTSKFWGAEIYSGQNRFGRYQSHGSLDVLYDGNLARNCYPTNNAVGGWDWNVVPGTTTVHYTSWNNMMPGGSTTQRFDQYSKTSNFSGALSLDGNGVFATDFDQIDKWGSSSCFLPTNLTFKKSMFAFNDMVVCMGSNISSSGTYSDDMLTATNLFQNIVTDYVGNLVVNGDSFEQGESRITCDKDNCFITPSGTGYFVPKGNDPIALKYGMQTTPCQAGSDVSNPTGTALATKAYIDHGVKPMDANDMFVVIPAATKEKMSDYSQKMSNNGGELFRVESRTAQLHALTYLPENTTAYAFYEAVDDIDFGIVKSTTFRHLLMVHPKETKDYYSFAVCNPDLCPIKDSMYKWRSSQSNTILTLRGEWQLVSDKESVNVVSQSDSETKIEVTMSEGEPVYFELKSLNDVGIEEKYCLDDNIRTEILPDGVHLYFHMIESSKIHIDIMSLDGKLLFKTLLPEGSQECIIPNSSFMKGLNVIRVAHNGGIKVIKVVL